MFLASTAENAIVDGIGENIIVTKNSSIDTTKNLIISAHYDSAEDSVAPMITVPEWQQCLNWQGF